PVLSGTVKVFGGLVSEDAKAFFERRPKNVALRDWPAWPTLAVNLDATRDNRIRTGVPQLQAVLSASGRLTGSPQDLEVRGDAQITQGSLRATFLTEPIERIEARTSKLEVRRNPVTRSFDPYVSFRATAETTFRSPTGGGSMQSDRVRMEVRGGVVPGPEGPVMSEWVVTARSDRALPQDEILARLTGRREFQRAMEEGKVQDFLRREITSAGIQAAWETAVGPAVEGLRRGLGLDQFQIRVESDRPVHIQAGKWLVKHLFVSYAIDVQGNRGTTQSLRVDYELAGGVTVGVQLSSEPEVRGSAEYHTRY
ncbi:MAG: translocation/assembly module TamB domain-containing protein, partial [Armatimonadetes bacterium]|nr:translocation/assembly module TamB domain-containing protein [Armatimonadota bacterium]